MSVYRVDTPSCKGAIECQNEHRKEKYVECKLERWHLTDTHSGESYHINGIEKTRSKEQEQTSKALHTASTIEYSRKKEHASNAMAIEIAVVADSRSCRNTTESRQVHTG